MKTIATLTITSDEFKESLKQAFADRRDVAGHELDAFGDRFFQSKADAVIREHQLECPETQVWLDPETKNMMMRIVAD